MNEDKMKAGLCDIIARTEAALQDLPNTQGRAKNQSRMGALKPSDICAIIVTKAWKMARNQDAKVNGEKEKRACERLCAAAGGDVSRQGGGSVAMWRDHMRVAREHLDSDAVKSILRPLTKASIHKPNEKRQATWYAKGE